jgi:large subunit ribosomal protein L15
MKLNELKKTVKTASKRLGRGYGSGVGGHTSTRGQKGQNSRNSMAIWFEGGQLPQIRRFPFIKGKGRFQSLKQETIEINLDQLNKLKANTVVTPKSLVEAGLVNAKDIHNKTIKILGRGELTVALKFNLPVSGKAKAKIEAAGGTFETE